MDGKESSDMRSYVGQCGRPVLLHVEFWALSEMLDNIDVAIEFDVVQEGIREGVVQYFLTELEWEAEEFEEML